MLRKFFLKLQNEDHSRDDTGYVTLKQKRTLRSDLVLEWLLECPEEDGQDVIRQLGEARPHLFTSHVRKQSEQVLAQSDCPRPAPQLPNTGADTSDIARFLPTLICDDPYYPLNDGNIQPVRSMDLLATFIQFSTDIHICSSNSTEIVLGVLRMGNLSHASEVFYETKDATAFQGVSYKACSGKLRFEKHQFHAQICVELIDTAKWTEESYFQVALKKEGLVNADLVEHMSTAIVHEFNESLFPSRRCEAEVEAIVSGESVPYWRSMFLLWEYIKMNWGKQRVRQGTIRRMFAAQVSNMCFLAHLLSIEFIVDFILNDEYAGFSETWRREVCLILVSSLILVAFALEHYAAYSSTTWSVGGPSRKIIQSGLLRIFLHCEPKAKNDRANWITVITRDVLELVSSGYSALLISLVGVLGKVFVLMAFQFISPLVFHKKLNYNLLLFSLAFPLLSPVLLLLRITDTNKHISQEEKCHKQLIHFVESILMNHELFSGYRKHGRVVEMLETHVSAYNTAHRHLNMVKVNNSYIDKWLQNLVLAAFTFIGGMCVLEGTVTLGTFVTVTRVLGKLGAAWGSVYQISTVVCKTLPSLERVVLLMNLDTELMHIARRDYASMPETLDDDATISTKTTTLLRRCHSRVGARELSFLGHTSLDHMPICLQDIKFARITTGLKKNLKWSLSFSLDCNIEIPQGKLVSVIGKPGHGKSTLLKLISGMLYNKGFSKVVVMPPHLHAIHVGTDPVLFAGSLYDNLIFGLKQHIDRKDTELMRNRSMRHVEAVCELLGINDDVLSRLSDCDDDSMPWSSVLSVSQRSLLSHARALIANPEVLCIEKPTLHYDDSTSMRVMKVLSDFVVHRGVEQTPDEWHLRRARTCIFTTAKSVGIEKSDLVILVKLPVSLEVLKPEEAVTLVRTD